LPDIEVVKEAQRRRKNFCVALLTACITCTLPCFLIGLLHCGSCCGDLPKCIGVKGGFGSEILTFKRQEAIDAANTLSAMIHPHKERK